MNDQSQADTSCRRGAIYTVMRARAAETHRSARPAASSQRLRFPRDHNEQAAVLRARGKSLARHPAPAEAACLQVSGPSSGIDGDGPQLASSPRRDLGTGWNKRPLSS